MTNGVGDVGVIGVTAPKEGDEDVPKEFIVLKQDVPANSDTQQSIKQLVEAQLTSYRKCGEELSLLMLCPDQQPENCLEGNWEKHKAINNEKI